MGNWREDTQSGLTRWYAKGRGGVVDESEYSAYGVTRTVFWYEQDSPRAGDYSPLGTILMNRTLPDGISEDVRDYVFLHEVGHDELNTSLRLLYWPTILLTGLLAFAAILALPINLLKAASLWTTPVSAVIYLGFSIIFSASLCVPVIAISWADELYADLHAISYMGLDRYLEIRRHIPRSETHPLSECFGIISNILQAGSSRKWKTGCILLIKAN